MNPLLRRIALHSAMSAVLLLPVLPVQATTPTDYAMPHTLGSGADGKEAGIKLVSSANFNQSATLVPLNTLVYETHVHLSGLIANNSYTDYRPQLLSWGQGNRWRLANLRAGLNPNPVQISNENGVNSVCTSQAIARSQRDAATNALVYQLPGPDGKCGNFMTGTSDMADNLVRAISLNDTPTTAPLALPLVGINFQPVYTGNGTLRALYAFDRGNLISFSTALSGSSIIAGGIGSLQFQGHTADGTVILIIDGNLRRIRPNGVLIARPLKTAGTGFKVVQAVIGGSDVYFVETAIDPTSRIQGRIYRVPADGSARATLLTSVRAPGSTIIQGLSDARVVFSAGGAFDLTTFKFRPTDLLTVPRGGGSDPIRLLRVASGFIATIHVSSDKVFYTATVIGASGGSFTQTAYISVDSGALVTNFRTGSAWSGAQFADAGTVLLQGDVRLLLAQKGLDGTTRGARLLSVKPADLSSARLALLSEKEFLPFGSGFGRGSIGSLQVNGDTNSGTDVFAFDLYGLRFRRLAPDAGTNNQFPIF